MTTLVKVLLIASESNGGLPTNKVYNMHPKLHTSASGPCDDLVATCEFKTLLFCNTYFCSALQSDQFVE
jgi:hypothetical protein